MILKKNFRLEKCILKNLEKFQNAGTGFHKKDDIREKVQAKQDHKEIIVLKTDGDERVLGTKLCWW